MKGNEQSNGLGERWAQGLLEMGASVAAWRREHPKATLTEIERALDERLGPMRAQMLSDAAVTSGAAHFGGAAKEDRPCCPQCGEPLVSRGPAERRLMGSDGREILLQRDYGACPACGTKLFPPG